MSASTARSPLDVAELFYYVLDFLAEPCPDDSPGPAHGVRTPTRSGRAALAVLAQTCRALTGPSLDYLWRSLTSLQPLFLLFNSRDDLRRGNKHFWHPPGPSGWAVLNQYLHRIRALQVSMDQATLFLLQSAIFETALLPNLQVLRWDPREDGTIMYIKPLICPTLAVLDVISYDADENALTSLFRTLPSRCPDLATVSFNSCSELNDRFKEPLCQALRNFKNVKRLSVHVSVEDTALQHIFMSSGLEELSLVTDAGQLEDFVVPSSDTVTPLRDVKRLDLWLVDLSLITKFLRPGHQKFQGMIIRLQKLELPVAYASFFAGLGSRTHTSRLESLGMYSKGTDPRRDVPAHYAFTSDALQPLFSFGHLRELSIQIENPIDMSDEELARVARGWPSLDTLDLCCIRPPAPTGKRLTLKGLVLLAAACRNLRLVALTLDALAVPTDVGVPEGSQFDAVVQVSCPNSPLGDGTAVGTFLVAYFPSLTSDGQWRTFSWGQPWDLDWNSPGWGPVWRYIDKNNGSEAEGDSDSDEEEE